MLRACWMLAFATGCFCLAGCNSSGTGGSDKSPPAPRKSASNGPSDALFQFLEAVRTGDDEKAAGMLTKTALKKIKQLKKEKGIDLQVAPERSDTAKFAIGKVENLPNNIAHVASTWTDEGESQKLVWALRKEPEGWRVAGMLMKLFDDQAPLILNFEDPEDMMAQQELAAQEMDRRFSEATSQASAKKKSKTR